MNVMVWLVIISVVAVSALFIALAVFLTLILRQLTPVGGTGVSYLAKIRLGLRAIEMETGNIPTEVTELNGGLSAVRDGLLVVDNNLSMLSAAVQQQGGVR